MPIDADRSRLSRRRGEEMGIPDPLDDAINGEFRTEDPVVPPPNDTYGAGGNRNVTQRHRDDPSSGIPDPTRPTGPTTSPTGPSPLGVEDSSPRGQIVAAYEKYLGRTPSESEIASQMGRGYNLGQSVNNIRSSAEADAFARRQRQSSTDDDEPDDDSPDTPNNNTADNSGGGASGYDYIPGGEGITWGDTSRLSGFNTNEWGPGGDPNYDENSYKNIFGKIATRYESSPDGLRQLINDPDFKRMFPRATLVDHPTDPKIKFEPGDPPVDVLASSGQRGWQWLPEGAGGGAAGGGGGGVTPGGGGGDDVDLDGSDSDTITDIDQLGENDILEDIQRALRAQGRGEQPYLSGAITKEFR